MQWEKEIKGKSADLEQAFHRVRPSKLKEIENVEFSIFYDPGNIPTTTIGKRSSITVLFPIFSYLFPGGKTWHGYDNKKFPPIEFNGYLSRFEPSETQEGEPEATITITPVKGDDK